MSFWKAPVAIRDVVAGMRVFLYPEGCPVHVLGLAGAQVLILMPDLQTRFAVPLSSLRRVERWRDSITAARSSA